MINTDDLKSQIREAFAHVTFPGDWCLRDSNEGDEPFLVEQAFRGKTDWRKLDPEFLDLAPEGYGSALSFFSDEAFHFYLPAYLLADVDRLLEHHNPVFHLIHGLTNDSRNKPINPRRFGERTWFHYAVHKFAMFNQREAAAIVAYLNYKRELCDFDQKEIDEALANYWRQRTTGPFAN